MGTHTISNAATFHGWLESVGLDDLLERPCSCLFGEDPDDVEIPVPGQRRSTRRGPPGGGVGPGGGGALSRQATLDIEEPKSPFTAFAFFGGGG